MAPPPRWIPYRRELTPPWYKFLRGLDCKFTRQKPLGQYVADFYCASQRLVIELDGDSHYTDQALRYDAARTEALGLLGIRVIRFTNLEVMQDFEAVCEIVIAALKKCPAP